MAAKFPERADGKPRDVHVAGRPGGAMDIHHGLAGGRRVEVDRPDHTRIMAERGGLSVGERRTSSYPAADLRGARRA
jgi:hypothetical protein